MPRSQRASIGPAKPMLGKCISVITGLPFRVTALHVTPVQLATPESGLPVEQRPRHPSEAVVRTRESESSRSIIVVKREPLHSGNAIIAFNYLSSLRNHNQLFR